MKRVIPSIRVLRERIETILDPQKLVYIYEQCELVWPSVDVADVVLLGGSPSLILQSVFWPPNQKIRVWVLSSASRRVLVECLNIPQEFIGLLPRSLLFPEILERLKREKRSNAFQTEPSEIVLSARAHKEKNLRLSLYIACEIQRQGAANRPRNSIPPVRIFGANLKGEELESLINGIDWLQKPDIFASHDAGIDWINQVARDAVLIQMSTSFEEDFGVSVAQAEARGLSLILSRWGAHHDTLVSPRVSVPADAVFEARLSPARSQKLARSVAQRYLRSHAKPEVELKKREALTAPMVTTYREINSSLKRLTSSKRRGIALVFRETSVVEPPRWWRTKMRRYFASRA